MPDHIPSLMNELEADPWRARGGFSPEVRSAMDDSLQTESTTEIDSVFNKWISKYQPCLFGRIAAKQSAIKYCFITENMLYGDESHIEQHIQEARLGWTAAGFEGHSSNFIIAILSPALASALPNDTVKRIALRLCCLYLQESIKPDHIFYDRLHLEQSSSSKATWEWLVGVNYFSAQGDGRWWHDHRFPAGMAFSMNSVGHMVKSGKLKRAYHELDEVMGTGRDEYKAPNVDSLEKALGLAMRTIHLASETISGKATFLLPRSESKEVQAKCPMTLPPDVSGTDHCTYRGLYHTDHTIPSEFFKPDVLRPVDLEPQSLDFTYLFDKSLDNPDFWRIGEGRRIRDAEDAEGKIGERVIARHLYPAIKRLRGVETEVRIADVPRLRKALRLIGRS